MEFYRDLKSFSDFSGINNAENFFRVPGNWVVLVTDVKGSTKAVHEGRFKDVNMLGASAITIVSNEMKTSNTVSVFGGDGATILMPDTMFDKLRPQFVGLIKLAKQRFGLELRVGAVRISDLDQLDSPIFVGKYQVSNTTTLAQMMGAGCTKAETLVKSGLAPAMCLTESEPSLPPNLGGLSCRLDSFQSRNGQILSIIVKPKQDGESTWVRNVLMAQIKSVLGGDLFSANPVSKSQLKWRLFSKTISAEIRFRQQKVWDFITVFLNATMANMMIKCNISAGGFVPEKYKSEIAAQSDFKKFDDKLRMVIDCTELQSKKIFELLDQAKAEGRIFYGVHKSRKAVVTCITYSAGAGDHVHFVDGEGCGYTNAAVQLKAQLA
jgi:hypothetical protein